MSRVITLRFKATIEKLDDVLGEFAPTSNIAETYFRVSPILFADADKIANDLFMKCWREVGEKFLAAIKERIHVEGRERP